MGDCEDNGVRCHVVPRTTHGFELFFPIACSRMVQFIRQGHGEPLKNEKGVSLFFHGAQSSQLYGKCHGLTLQVLEAFTGLFCIRGHSPFNFEMLSYLDEYLQACAGSDTDKTK